MEMFDVLDDSGQVVGIASREDCHNGSHLLHAVVHVLVFDNSGHIILQKRADTKFIQPGKWDTSVGGHIESGESLGEALRREAYEEMGIHEASFTPLYMYIMENDIERELVNTFLCEWSEDITFPDDEISEIRAFTNDEIESRLGTGFFTPNFEQEWEYYKQWKIKGDE